MRSASRIGKQVEGCVVCGRNEGRILCEKGRFSLMLCECGGSYLSPWPDTDEVDFTHDPHPVSFYALPAKQKVRWLARSVPAGDLLEVGCGEGYFLQAARSQGYRVRGIEAHPERSARAATRLQVPVECALLEESRTEEGCADVVYHCDLLSHFPDPVGALQRMGRMLRRDGVLFFEVGLHGSILPYWYRSMAEHSVPRHRWFFDERALRRLLDTAGFQVERIQRFGLGHQVLFYKLAGPVVRGARRSLRLIRGASRTARSTGSTDTPTASATTAAPAESVMQSQVENFLRFRLSRVLPPAGPSTCFVIARPVAPLPW